MDTVPFHGFGGRPRRPRQAFPLRLRAAGGVGMGDSTFFHAALPALVNVTHNQPGSTCWCLDNCATAMTGCQARRGHCRLRPRAASSGGRRGGSHQGHRPAGPGGRPLRLAAAQEAFYDALQQQDGLGSGTFAGLRPGPGPRGQAWRMSVDEGLCQGRGLRLPPLLHPGLPLSGAGLLAGAQGPGGHRRDGLRGLRGLRADLPPGAITKEQKN